MSRLTAIRRPRQPGRPASCRASLPPESVAVSGAEPRRSSGESWPSACSSSGESWPSACRRPSAMTGESGRSGPRQHFRARLPERQCRGQAAERHGRMRCQRLSTAYAMTAVPRPISCCRATTRTNKWQGRSTPCGHLSPAHCRNAGRPERSLANSASPPPARCVPAPGHTVWCTCYCPASPEWRASGSAARRRPGRVRSCPGWHHRRTRHT